MAEALFRKQLAAGGVVCVSAGTHALVGHAADQYAQEVMLDHGYDIAAHRAQQALPELLKQADLILGLDQLHIDWLIHTGPHLRGRVFKLGRWNGNADVPDPYRKPRAAFVEAYATIEKYVAGWVPALLEAPGKQKSRN